MRIVRNYAEFPDWVDRVGELSQDRPSFVTRKDGPYQQMFEVGYSPELAVATMRRTRKEFVWATVLCTVGLIVGLIAAVGLASLAIGVGTNGEHVALLCLAMSGITGSVLTLLSAKRKFTRLVGRFRHLRYRRSR
jgi:hypothetical protein